MCIKGARSARMRDPSQQRGMVELEWSEHTCLALGHWLNGIFKNEGSL